ncbi:MAG: dienelactone hydrolase family protein [Sphingomonadaceae bacterium]|nr:dienelactone hydrolase family protein [Sphingomonadaceae bacterium]
MCDDLTAKPHDAALNARGLSRRQFSALGAAVAAAGCAPPYPGTVKDGELLEEAVHITTQDGVADGFFVHPAKGAYPGVIMWPDIAGLREAKKIMARRLAGAGYAVLVANQYYRSAPAPVMESFSEFMEAEGRKRVLGYRELLTPDAVTSDAKAWVAFLDSKAAVDKARGIGSSGYCMGGPFTVRSAAAVPDRIKAAASFHGGGLVTDEPDSPHRLMEKTQASFLLAVARNDDERRPGDKDELRKAADAAGRLAEIEVYDADHGWCVPDSPVWNPSEADRAWNRMLALYAKL